VTFEERLASLGDLGSPRGWMLGVVGAAWVAALLAYGWGDSDLARDDLCYLTTLHDFLMGFEARKDYGHLSWGVLHLVGHSPLGASSWADGRPGALLVLFATTIVPFCAYVAYRLAWVVACMAARRPLAERAPGEPEVAPSARAAAILAAWSPAVLVGAGTLGFWVRAGSVGFALLAAVQVLEYLEEGRGTADEHGGRRLVLAGFLFSVGLALHPWALTGLAVMTPLLLARLWRHRARAIPALGALVACGALFVGFLLLSGQGHRADHGASHLGEALELLPLATAAHGAWQVPGGALLRVGTPLAVAVCFTAAFMAFGVPLLNRSLRPVPLLALGGLLAALPEATAPFPPRDWVAVWTGNFIKASVGMELLVPVIVGLFVGQVRLSRQATRVQPPRWFFVALFVGVSAMRAATFLPTERDALRQNAVAGGIAGDLLTAAARTAEPLTVVPSLSLLARTAAPARFNPEVSELRRLRAALDKGKAKAAGPYAGLDLALWRTSAMRCELHLGLGGADGIVPDDPAAFHDSPCQRRPRSTPTLSQTAACQYVALGDKPQIICPPGIPPHAGPLDSRDPASLPLGLLGLAAIALGLALSDRYTLASD